MSRFEPGEGWREVPGAASNDLAGREYIFHGDYDGGHYWVPVESVPPLPTERGTVIKVHWGGGACEWVVLWGGQWRNVATGRPSDLSGATGFEVVAEPRAVTAKAVLDRVRGIFGPGALLLQDVDRIAAEFGVTR